MNIEKETQKEQIIQHFDVNCSKDAFNPINVTYEKLIYQFDKDYWLEFSYHDNSTYGVITFRLPEDIFPSQIEKIQFVQPQIPKTSWGGLAYYGEDINKKLASEKKFVDYASNQVACSINDITFKGKKFEGINVDAYDAWGAHFKSQQALWFNWFMYKEQHFIQIFYMQYAESWRSVSNGKMWWNLGKGLEINLLQPE